MHKENVCSLTYQKSMLFFSDIPPIFGMQAEIIFIKLCES